MAIQFPPAPPGDPSTNAPQWREWFSKLPQALAKALTALLPWADINFAGSTLTDLQTRKHSDLQGLQGGTTLDYQHLTTAQLAQVVANLHNALSGLQGGLGGQYYHMNAAEYTGTGTGVVVRQNAPSFTGSVTLPGGSVLLVTSSSLGNGSAAALGTLTNAPAAGNPSKWIPINDNGTTRYIPAW